MARTGGTHVASSAFEQRSVALPCPAMGKSIRAKVNKKWRAQRREKLDEWERQRTQELHDRLVADVRAPEFLMVFLILLLLLRLL